MLRITDPCKDYVACIDASKEGVGGVLIHEGHVIFYESHKLKDYEKKYALHNLELITFKEVCSPCFKDLAALSFRKEISIVD